MSPSWFVLHHEGGNQLLCVFNPCNSRKVSHPHCYLWSSWVCLNVKGTQDFLQSDSEKKAFCKKKQKTKTQIWSELSVFDQCVNLPVIHIGVVAFFTSCKFCGHLRQREHWNRTVATYSFWSNLSLVFSHQHQVCLLFFNYMCRTSRTTRVCESFCLL